MRKHAGDSICNGQAKTQAAFLAIVEFVQPPELFEYLLALIRRNAATRVPDFDAQLVASAPAAQEHSPAARIAYRVGEEVLQYAPQQLRIRENDVIAIGGAQTQPSIARHHREFRRQAPDHLRKREMFQMGFLRARIQSRNIKQSAEESLAGDMRRLGLGDERSVGRR